MNETKFYRGDSEKYKRLFTSKAALIRRGASDKGLTAAYKGEGELAFKDQITGVISNSEHEALLKWLVVLVNSSLIVYYNFMTSTSWGVERGRLIQQEFLEIPFLVPKPTDLERIVTLFNQIVVTKSIHSIIDYAVIEHNMSIIEAELNEIVYDIYELTKAERIIVSDALAYTIDFFNWSQQTTRVPSGSLAVQKPNVTELEEYTRVYIETINALARYRGFELNAKVYTNGAPLCVVEFTQMPYSQGGHIETIQASPELHKLLGVLDKRLLQNRSSIYMRRHVRIYDGRRFYLVRPSEKRFWTRAQALADADETINEWFQGAQLVSKVH